MAGSVKKKDISSSLSDAANSVKIALGWKEEEPEKEETPVELTEEEKAKRKKEGKPLKSFSDFATSYRKEIGK